MIGRPAFVLAAAAVLTVALCVPERPGPTRPQTSTADDAAAVRYARIFLSTDTVNTVATQAARWPLLIGQGDHADAARQVRAADPAHVTTAVYADPLAIRLSDPNGITTATKNSRTVARHRDWGLLDAAGNPIKARDFSLQDYAADIGNTGYQQASVSFLLAKVRKAGWGGVFLDDTNPTPDYTFAERPAKYPTDASWQAAELSYIRAVCGAVRDAGFACYLNLGAQNTAWARSIARLSTGPMTEQFVAMDVGEDDPPELATIENGLWAGQLQWAQWAETHTSNQIVHAYTTDAGQGTYALASYLLVSAGTGSFAVSRDYGSDTEWQVWPQAFTDAQALGAAEGAYVADAGGVYYRDFTYGRVVVNPHDTARVFDGTRYPPTTGTITLNS